MIPFFLEGPDGSSAIFVTIDVAQIELGIRGVTPKDLTRAVYVGSALVLPSKRLFPR